MRVARRVLERLEDSLRTAVESIGGLLPGKLEPLELAAELSRAMDQSQMAAAEGKFAANDYRVLVGAEDLELLGGLLSELEVELAQALAEHAAERGYLVGPTLTVRIEADPHSGGGRLRVESSFAERPVPARLEILAGLPPRVFDFVGDIELGRSETCSLSLDEEAISRRHARIGWTYPGYVLEDLGSSNRTFVNGRRVDRVLLRGGEVIEIGLVQLRFSYQR